MTRVLAWDGCVNVRDLGGLPLDDGGETAYRVVVRFLEEFAPNFATVVAALADADGPAVVHCAGGKDRTGLVCALALRLAGVPAKAIEDDWALSEAAWDHDREEWIASAADEVERNRRRIWSVAPRPAMAETLAELERSHGGARGYLEDAGMRASALDRLRARLRGEA